MKQLMAANWKMYKTREEAGETLKELASLLTGMPENREVVIFAPFTCLNACSDTLKNETRISLGAQDCYPQKEGAFTGEVSPGMILDCGADYVLTGHSERRSILNESDDFVGSKTSFALKNGLKTILCVGESLEERDGGKLEEVLVRQLQTGLKDVPDDTSPDCLAIAYEPVWAIGTGRVAGPEEILESHAVVRKFLKIRFARQGASLRILYGGSVKAENASAIMQLENVNGVLVGGASLRADSFSRIVLA